MKTVNMKNIIVEIKNRINKINNPNDAGKEIICLPEDQTEHSQKNLTICILYFLFTFLPV